MRFRGAWSVESDVDLNILNFERHKWGDVRRDDLIYVCFDPGTVRQGTASGADRARIEALCRYDRGVGLASSYGHGAQGNNPRSAPSRRTRMSVR